MGETCGDHRGAQLRDDPADERTVADQSIGLGDRDAREDVTIVVDAGDVGNEEKPVGLEPHRERSGSVVGVDIQRTDAKRRDNRNAAGHECLNDRSRPTGQGIPDPTEGGQLNGMEPDLISEETDRTRAERGAQRPVDGGKRRAHDRQARLRGDASAPDELDRDPEPFHLLGDLRSGAVNDAYVMTCLGEPQNRAGRLVCDAATALDDDEAHERYSALMRT